MYPVVADSLTSGLVLRDFGVVVIVALIIGLGFHFVRRYLSGSRDDRSRDGRENLVEDGEIALPPPRPPLAPLGIPGETISIPLPPPPSAAVDREDAHRSQGPAGIDASHFTRWDFVTCFAILSLFLMPVFLMKDASAAVTETTLFQQITNLGFQIVLYGFLASLIVSIIQWVGMRDPVRVFGLRNLSFPKAFGWILVGSALGIVSVWWISELSAMYAEALFQSVETQGAVQSFEKAKTVEQIVLLSISAVVLAPLFEELLFRGYLYGVLKKYTDPMFAACFSGAIFGLIHMTVPAVLPLWFFGIFLALAYEFTRCLWVPIGIHAVFNATSIIGILTAPKTDPDAESAVETVAAIATLLP